MPKFEPLPDSLRSEWPRMWNMHPIPPAWYFGTALTHHIRVMDECSWIATRSRYLLKLYLNTNNVRIDVFIKCAKYWFYTSTWFCRSRFRRGLTGVVWAPLFSERALITLASLISNMLSQGFCYSSSFYNIADQAHSKPKRSKYNIHSWQINIIFSGYCNLFMVEL